jgi:hypothetical protein
MEREQLKVLWDGMSHTLNEMQRRQYAATLSKAYGYGGAAVVHEITGLALNTITRGKKELSQPAELRVLQRVRKPGGGPKWTEEKYPDIQGHIRQIVEDSSYGNSEKVLSWTTDSLPDIERKLSERYGRKVTHVTVGSILAAMGYSRQANQKMLQRKPLIDVETAINLIGSTSTSTGLKVICQRDNTVYETAQSVSDEEYETIPLTLLAPFESWNYVLNQHLTS